MKSSAALPCWKDHDRQECDIEYEQVLITLFCFSCVFHLNQNLKLNCDSRNERSPIRWWPRPNGTIDHYTISWKGVETVFTLLTKQTLQYFQELVILHFFLFKHRYNFDTNADENNFVWKEISFENNFVWKETLHMLLIKYTVSLVSIS